VRRAAAIVADAPERWPLKDGMRRYVLGRFPYTIAYRFDDAVVFIIAIAHHGREPGSWSSRR
jgi:hypothetical protein